MNTLSDRYIAAAVRNMKEPQRADIERELRGSIEDDVEARVEAGQTANAAEHAALKELGNPDRLAASYQGKQLHLIGPELYSSWSRLLKLLLGIAVPFVTALVVFEQFDAGASGMDVVGSALDAAITLTVQLAFWLTLVFALMERSDSVRRRIHREWDPKDLPAVTTQKRMGIPELALSLIAIALVIFALFWQQNASFFVIDGSTVPLLDPANWSFWWPYFIAVLALQSGFYIWVWREGHYTYLAVSINLVLQLLILIPAIWLLDAGVFFNQEFVDQLRAPASNLYMLANNFIVVIGAMIAVNFVVTAIRARRASRLSG